MRPCRRIAFPGLASHCGSTGRPPCQLVRREGLDAVYVLRWWWDGAVRERTEYAADTAVAPPLEREPTAGVATLFERGER